MGCIQSKPCSTPVVDIRGQRPQLQADEAWLSPQKTKRPKLSHYKRRKNKQGKGQVQSHASKPKFTKVKSLKRDRAPSKTNLKEVLKRPTTSYGKRVWKKRGENSNSASGQQEDTLHYEPLPVPTGDLQLTPYYLIEIDSDMEDGISVIDLDPIQYLTEEAVDTLEGNFTDIREAMEIEEEPECHWQWLPGVFPENETSPRRESKAAAAQRKKQICADAVEKNDKKVNQKKGVTFVLPADSAKRVNSGACDDVITEVSNSVVQQVAQVPDGIEGLDLCIEGVRISPSNSEASPPPTESKPLFSLGSCPPMASHPRMPSAAAKYLTTNTLPSVLNDPTARRPSTSARYRKMMEEKRSHLPPDPLTAPPYPECVEGSTEEMDIPHSPHIEKRTA